MTDQKQEIIEALRDPEPQKVRSRWGYMPPEVLMGGEPTSFDGLKKLAAARYEEADANHHVLKAFLSWAAILHNERARRGAWLGLATGVLLGAFVALSTALLLGRIH